MLRGLSVASVLVVLAIAPGASAHATRSHFRGHRSVHHARHRHAPDPVDEAVKAAVRYWGGASPCRGRVAIRFGQPPANITTNGVPVAMVWGWASFRVVLGSPSLVVGLNGTPASFPPTVYTDCSVGINRHFWTRPRQFRYWGWFCALMVHEYGHLYGHPDNAADPVMSIMYPALSLSNVYVGSCARRYWLFPHMRF